MLGALRGPDGLPIDSLPQALRVHSPLNPNPNLSLAQVQWCDAATLGASLTAKRGCQ